MRSHRSVGGRLGAIGIAVALIALAASCARSDDQGTASSPTDAVSTTSTERPAGPPQPGGTVTVGLGAETNDLVPPPSPVPVEVAA